MFAHLEYQPILPQHQDKGIQYVIDRLKEVKDKKIQELKAIRVAIVNSTNTNYKSNDILILKKENENSQIIRFSNKQILDAYLKYQKLENEFKNNKKVEIVMFSVNDGKKINKSYPNFFNDTKKFIEKIEEYYKQYDTSIFSLIENSSYRNQYI